MSKNVDYYCTQFSPYRWPATRDRLLTTTQSFLYDTFSDSGSPHIPNIPATLVASTPALLTRRVFSRISDVELGGVRLLPQV